MLFYVSRESRSRLANRPIKPQPKFPQKSAVPEFSAFFVKVLNHFCIRANKVFAAQKRFEPP
jgi:hypothetical protein